MSITIIIALLLLTTFSATLMILFINQSRLSMVLANNWNINKIICRFGVHNWSDWEYQEERHCPQISTCSRCNKSKTRIKHEEWSEWSYKESNQCLQVSNCIRCNELREQWPHNWNGWTYIEHNSCKQENVCSRCGKVNTQESSHFWGTWQSSTFNCARSCTRCSKQETKPHNWSVWTANGYAGDTRYCLNCGYREYESHSWGMWHNYRDNEERRTCMRCGDTETRTK